MSRSYFLLDPKVCRTDPEPETGPATGPTDSGGLVDQEILPVASPARLDRFNIITA